MHGTWSLGDPHLIIIIIEAGTPPTAETTTKGKVSDTIAVIRPIKLYILGTFEQLYSFQQTNLPLPLIQKYQQEILFRCLPSLVVLF